MKIVSRIVVAGAAVAAAGCTNLDGGSLGRTFTAESYLEQEIGGASFNDHLAREYQLLAAYNADTMVNWIDTTAYIERSKAAAAGSPMPLFQPASYGVNSNAEALRGETIAAVQDYADERPEACAEAMALYDHYVEALYQAPGEDPEMAEEQFLAALAECQGAGPMEGVAVFFGFDRSDLTNAARNVVEDVVAMMGDLMDDAVSVVGHTDTVGGNAYNQALSERRAASVRDYMVSLGVPSSAIFTAGRGEQELRVPTADGVREAENRRVEISVSEQ
jgi:OOP family OmpA-OmpF porin